MFGEILAISFGLTPKYVSSSDCKLIDELIIEIALSIVLTERVADCKEYERKEILTILEVIKFIVSKISVCCG